MKLPIYLLFATSLTFSSFTKKDDATVINQVQRNQITIDRDSIIIYAKKYLGIPYLYAGNNPQKGFDCSGFVSYIFNNFDINLPRSSNGYKNLGTALAPEDFKVGDILVFYGYKDRTVVGHVGIVCEANGMHSKFIHASSGKANKVTISELDSDHYTKRFYKCIDVLSK
jgi:cell wall-associated NlpC family hydrolase